MLLTQQKQGKPFSVRYLLRSSDIFVFICFLKVVETRHCQIQFVVDIFLNDFLLLIMCLSEVPF